MRTLSRILVVISVTVPLAQLPAQLRLPNVFADHMVLQRDQPVRIWGWATPGASVGVRFADRSVNAIADADGSFVAELAPLAASATPRELVVSSAATTRTVADILVGEVWVCGGQSNMEWRLASSRDADIEIPCADSPNVRFLRIPKVARFTSQDDFPVRDRSKLWRACIPEHVGECTAVGYYFARRLHRALRVPIGIIDTSWGGTMAQHWVTRETLETIDEMKPYLEDFDARRAAWIDGGREQGAQRRFEADTAAWEAARATAVAEGQREPRRPRRDAYDDPSNQAQPGGMMNGVVAPIARFAIRGVLFYQGENNSFATAWKPFPKTFPAVIRDWRAAFGDVALPFGIVQIAGWSNRRTMPYDMNHHCNITREVQFDTWRRTAGTGLIVTFDTNSSGSIHPSRKLPVGERSARWALAEVYGLEGRGKPLEWRGPIFESIEIDGARIRISFEEGTAEGLRLDQDVEVGFYIAGDDREFRHAHARIRAKERQVEVWSDAIPHPVTVRYGWSNLPAGGLMNGRELPAYPFRSDDWPLTPHQSTGDYRR